MYFALIHTAAVLVSSIVALCIRMYARTPHIYSVHTARTQSLNNIVTVVLVKSSLRPPDRRYLNTV